MGEETDNPGRNIPRALAGTLLLTGVLFVVVMFAQVNGFGTDQAGLDAFQNSGNTLGDLGGTYVGQWFGLVIIFTAIVSAFGCHLATLGDVGSHAVRVRTRRLRPEGVGAHPRRDRRSAPRHLAGRRSSRSWST